MIATEISTPLSVPPARPSRGSAHWLRLDGRGCVSADGRSLELRSPPAGDPAAPYRTGAAVVEAENELFRTPPGLSAVDVALSPGGRFLAVTVHNPNGDATQAACDMDSDFVRELVVYEVATGLPVLTAEPLANSYVALAWSPGGRFLMLTGQRYPIDPAADDPDAPVVEVDAGTADANPPHQIWDVEAGREIARLGPDFGKDRRVPRLPGGLLICPRQEGGTVFVSTEDLAAARPPRVFLECDLPHHGDSLVGYTQSPGGGVVAAREFQTGSVFRWDSATGHLIDVTPCPFGPAGADDVRIEARADGTVLVLSATGAAWVAPGGTVLEQPPVRPAARWVAAVPGGREFLAWDRGAPALGRWCAETGAPLGAFPLPADVVREGVGLRVEETGHVRIDNGFRTVTRLHPATGERADIGMPNQTTPPVYLSRHLHRIALHEAPDSIPVDPRPRALKPVRVTVAGPSTVGPQPLFDFVGTAGSVHGDGPRVLVTYGPAGRDATHAVYYPDEYRMLWDGAAWFAEYPDRPAPEGARRVDRYTTHACWSADGDSILILPRHAPAPFVVDAATGEVLSEWCAAIAWPMAAHPARPVLAAAGPGGVRLHDWTTGAVLATLPTGAEPQSLAWGGGAAGDRLMVGCADGTARLYAIEG